MATKEFEEVFHSNTSGSVRTCKCGRTYFDGDLNDYDWEKGELEDLLEKALMFPTKFYEKEHSIQTMTIGVHEFVIGCECNGAQVYEDFINQNDKKIAEYLNKKAERLKNKAADIEVKDGT